MGLTFFADHCISQAIIRKLLDAGHEVLVLRDHLPQDAPDPVVIEKAQLENAILITLNGDFSDIVAYPPSEFVGIIALQLKNRPSMLNPIMERLLSFTESHPNQGDYIGLLLLVEGHRIRIRK
ncbi:MAG: DUF5615 family PIN-like protein [Bacteroidota bacterium]